MEMNITKRYLFMAALGLASMHGVAQKKVISEAVITYRIQVADASTANKAVAAVFDGATLRVTVKGFQARSEFISPMRNQTILFDGKQKTGMLLRESGNEKYMMPMDANEWMRYNARFENINWVKLGNTKTIEGTPVVNWKGTLKDGTEIIAWVATDMDLLARGYDGQFTGLEGLPMEYEVTNSGVKVNYLVTSIAFQPVNSARFDPPTAGYKVLKYNQ